MRTLLVFIVGIAVGAVAYYYWEAQPHAIVHATAHDAAGSARDAANGAATKTRAFAADVSQAFNDKIREWHLTRADIHADLEKSGQVARENVGRLREKVSDARIVTVIKAKLVLDRNLSATEVGVQAADGDVTLTGSVSSEDLIGRAVALALDTEGVHHVTAKLKVASKP